MTQIWAMFITWTLQCGVHMYLPSLSRTFHLSVSQSLWPPSVITITVYPGNFHIFVFTFPSQLVLNLFSTLVSCYHSEAFCSREEYWCHQPSLCLSELLLGHDLLYLVLLIFWKLAPGLACRTPHYSSSVPLWVLCLFPFPGPSSSCPPDKRHSIPEFHLGLSAILAFAFSLANHFFLFHCRRLPYL